MSFLSLSLSLLLFPFSAVSSTIKLKYFRQRGNPLIKTPLKLKKPKLKPGVRQELNEEQHFVARCCPGTPTSLGFLIPYISEKWAPN